MTTRVSKRLPRPKNSVGAIKFVAGVRDLSKIRVKLRESAQNRLSGGKAAAAFIITSRHHQLLYVARREYRSTAQFRFPALNLGCR
jgi:hypothetical protein